MADFLVALATFDRDSRWIELGFKSLFDFLHRELGLSKGASFYRMTAAHLLQRHPGLVEPLRDGRLCLSSSSELAKILTPENLDEVLPRFFHASKREAKEVVAELQPVASPPMRTVITPVRAAPTPAAPPAIEIGQAVHPDEPPAAPVSTAPPPRPERSTVEP